MLRYEFKIVTVHRHDLHESASGELQRLNEAGFDGWRVIAIRDDPRDHSNLVFFMERERT